MQKILRIALLLAFTSSCAAQSVHERPPIVIAAAVPFYPPLARQTRIEGKVLMKITTDGRRVVSAEIVSGHPLLAEAAKQNVRTWEFEKHEPTAFSTTFEYRVLAESVCERENGEIVLNYPQSVEITVKGIQTCDPSQTVIKKR